MRSRIILNIERRKSKHSGWNLVFEMLKLLLFLTCFTLISTLHVTKMASEVTVFDTDLPRQEHLNLRGLKKVAKGNVEHVIIRNCTGVIDDKTFKGFPKLTRLTIWRSNIEEISTTLPVSRLMVVGSHFPNLNEDLQQKLPKLQSLLLLGNKHFQVDSNVLKNFKKLTGLYISEANFTEDCITKEWFRGLDALQELGLSDNNLNCLAEDAFNGLNSLQKLDLTYNHIPDLEKKVFKKLTKLEKLGLYENDLELIDLGSLASQKNHLEALGVSWNVLKNSRVSAEDLLQALPKLQWVSFGHKEMPNDFQAGEFCQMLRQHGASCEIDSVFGLSKILGYSMLGSEPC